MASTIIGLLLGDADVMVMKWPWMLILWFLALSPLYAQDDLSTPPVHASQEPEAVTALAFADGVFEPEIWRVVSAAEHDLRTKVHWEAAQYGAIAFLDYLHFDEGLQGSAIKAYFNRAWFDGTFSDYEQYWRSGQCEFDDVRLFNFSLRYTGTKYVMRYWVIPVSETRIAAFFLLFPAQHSLLLERYARRFAPLAAQCP